MNYSNPYKLLNTTIKDVISKSHPAILNTSFFVEFLYQPTFSNDFSLQLVLNGNYVAWHRVTWLKDLDHEIIETWLRYCKDDGEILPLNLSLKHENGKTDMANFRNLISQIESLSIKPFRFDDTPFGRDGEEITLKISSRKSTSIFNWLTSSTPSNWHDLDKLVETLLELNETKCL